MVQPKRSKINGDCEKKDFPHTSLPAPTIDPKLIERDHEKTDFSVNIDVDITLQPEQIQMSVTSPINETTEV